MNDNRNHIGPNWSSRAPRTMEEAYRVPTSLRPSEPTVKEVVSSVAMLVAFVAVMGFFFEVGSYVF